MHDPFATLGFAQSRLLRHSSEQPESAVPSPDAPGTRLVLFVGDRPVLRAGTALHEAGTVAPEGAAIAQRIFLGSLDGRPVFALGLNADAGAAYEAEPFTTLDLRSIATEGAVEPHELGLLATAKSMLDWHARHGFCARCGTPTEMRAGGFRRECPNCQAHHFPRTDPVVIMLVRRGGTCLLGRGPHFKEGMYSCPASRAGRRIATRRSPASWSRARPSRPRSPARSSRRRASASAGCATSPRSPGRFPPP